MGGPIRLSCFHASYLPAQDPPVLMSVPDPVVGADAPEVRSCDPFTEVRSWFPALRPQVSGTKGCEGPCGRECSAPSLGQDCLLAAPSASPVLRGNMKLAPPELISLEWQGPWRDDAVLQGCLRAQAQESGRPYRAASRWPARAHLHRLLHTPSRLPILSSSISSLLFPPSSSSSFLLPT